MFLAVFDVQRREDGRRLGIGCLELELEPRRHQQDLHKPKMEAKAKEPATKCRALIFNGHRSKKPAEN